jgi:hypothetical protein
VRGAREAWDQSTSITFHNKIVNPRETRDRSSIYFAIRGKVVYIYSLLYCENTTSSAQITPPKIPPLEPPPQPIHIHSQVMVTWVSILLPTRFCFGVYLPKVGNSLCEKK